MLLISANLNCVLFFILRHFLSKNPISSLFTQLQDYKVSFNNGNTFFTVDSCGDKTFEDIADGVNFVQVEYRLQDKFKNASMLNFVNLFGEKVKKTNDQNELSSVFLRDPERELITIYVDQLK